MILKQKPHMNTYHFIEQEFESLWLDDSLDSISDSVSHRLAGVSVIIFSFHMNQKFISLLILTHSNSINLCDINLPICFYIEDLEYRTVHLLFLELLKMWRDVIKRFLSCLKPNLLYFDKVHDKYISSMKQIVRTKLIIPSGLRIVLVNVSFLRFNRSLFTMLSIFNLFTSQ